MIAFEAATVAAGRRLAALAPKARAALSIAVTAGAAQLLEAVHAAGPLGAGYRLDGDGDAVRVFSAAPFAHIQEYGGRISLPEIVPVAAKALAFSYEGKKVFAKHVRAHSVGMPPRPVLAPALAAVLPMLKANLAAALADSL